MRIPKHIQDVISKQDLHTLATATPDGVPNIIYVKFLKVHDDERVLIANNKFQKTEENLSTNPQLAFVVLDEENHCSYQLKGTVSIHNDDEIFKETARWVEDEAPRPDIRAKAGVLLHVEEIYKGAEKIEEE